jgi:hypothetical protein
LLSHKSSILPFISFLCVFKNADPDVPVHYRINEDPDDDPDPIPGQGFDDQNRKKNLQLKNFLLSEIAIFLSLVIHKGTRNHQP